jgi:GNAT superfamily N-acetyltransferase
MTSAHAEKTWHIRPARLPEADLLSRLALRSKGHWGYPAEFLEACREQLTLSVDFIATSPVFVLEENGVVVGFYGLRRAKDAVELLYLFIEPEAINRGYGRLLWEHAVRTATALGHRKISIESDPQAEAFYLAMGARRVGIVASTVQAGRMLPVLEFPLL